MQCGGPTSPPSKPTLDSLLALGVERAIDRWQTKGLLEASMAASLRRAEALPDEASDEDLPSGSVELEYVPPVSAFSTFARTARESAARWNRLVAEVESSTPKVEPPRDDDDVPPSLPRQETRLESSQSRHAHVSGDATTAAEAGRGLFHAGNASDAGEGLDGLASLDDTTDRGSSIALSQVALWFLGTLLVLAGSVLGVREAFRALAGPPRQVVVAGVFFAYYALFLGLSSLVSRKSVLAGRVLGGISVALLPIGFVALEALVQGSRALGIGLSVLALVGSWMSLRVAGKRLAGVPDPTLPYVVVPSLVATLLVGFAPSDTVRVAVPLVGIASTALAARRLALAKSFAVSVGAFVVALYAALALGIFAVLGAPGAAGVDLVPGSLAHGLLAFDAAVLATIVAEAFGGVTPRRDSFALSFVLELTSYAGLAVAGTFGARALASGASGSLGASSHGLVLAAGPLAAAFGFAAGSRRHGLLFHASAVFAFVAVFVLGTHASGLSGGFVATAVLGALSIAASRFAQRRRLALEAWGTATGLLGVLLGAITSHAPIGKLSIVTAESVALVVALAAHAAGGLGRARLHLVGAMATFLAICIFLAKRPGGVDLPTVVTVSCALAAAYGLVALAHGALLVRRTTDPGERPFDDLSLGIAALTALVASQLPGRDPASSLAVHADGLALREAWEALSPRALPLACAGALLVLRALRDRSRLVAFLGALALGQAAILSVGASTGAACVMVSGMLAAAFSASAAVRPSERAEPTRGRLLLGSLPLPFGARRFDLLDGVSAAGLVFLARTIYETIGFLGARSEPARERVLLGLAMGIGTMLLAFVSASHRALGLRGRSSTLAMGALVVAVTAVANRLGRPLPPEIVGRNLSLVAPGLWLASRGLLRVGPRWGASLGRPREGAYYTYVPLAGTVAVGLLLAVDVALVSGSSWTRALVVSPPMLVFGASLVALLVARTLEGTVVGRSLERTAALGLVLVALTAAAQKGLLGPHLVPSGRLGTPWIVRGTELIVQDTPNGFSEPSALLPAGETLAAYVVRGQWGLFASAAVLSSLVLATRSPGLASLLSRGLLGRDEPSEVRAFATTGIAASVLFALLVAGLVPSLESPATALTMGFGVVALGVLARRLRGDGSKVIAALAVALAGLQSAFVVIALGSRGLPLEARASDALSSLDVGAALTRFGPELSLGVALVAAIAHGLVSVGRGRASSEPFADARIGASAGRDAMLLASLLVLAFVASGGTKADVTRPSGFVALGVVLLVSGHAMVRDRTARHAYLIQVGFVAGYAFVRLAIPEASPFFDAVAALVYGFLLVGATALARKLELAPVAVATRRFATALPVLVVLLRPTGGGVDSASLAAGASVLYATLAVFDTSRILGAFAAFAANVALLFVALAAGFDGPEAYFGPLGLFLALLVQLFTPKLDLPTRRALRIVASLLVYAPVAVRLATRLGSSSDGTTSVLFGALCFVGIVIGMVLHVRAYVVLGTLFVTFDVLANLVFAGLRDHRVGFVLLSVSGLGILGIMIGTTLAREKALAFYTRVKGAMRGWE